MRLTASEKKEFIRNLRELLATDQLYEMQKYIQHGNTSTFSHCLVVAYYSYLLSLRLPLQYDTISIIRGAMLHDFYLYDWHIPDKSHRLHGYVHPGFALTNARKYFTLNPIEEDIIKKHMWPMTISKVPLYKESMLVSIVDKICSLAETFYIPMAPKEYRIILKYLKTKSPAF
jgi:uncharacterized protein